MAHLTRTRGRPDLSVRHRCLSPDPPYSILTHSDCLSDSIRFPRSLAPSSPRMRIPIGSAIAPENASTRLQLPHGACGADVKMCTHDCSRILVYLGTRPYLPVSGPTDHILLTLAQQQAVPGIGLIQVMARLGRVRGFSKVHSSSAVIQIPRLGKYNLAWG